MLHSAADVGVIWNSGLCGWERAPVPSGSQATLTITGQGHDSVHLYSIYIYYTRIYTYSILQTSKADRGALNKTNIQ